MKIYIFFLATMFAAILNLNAQTTVTTLAGSGKADFANGQGTDAMFDFSGQNWYRSFGVVVDDKLNVYVADPGNHCIRKIDTAGSFRLDAIGYIK